MAIFANIDIIIIFAHMFLVKSFSFILFIDNNRQNQECKSRST